MQLDKMVNYHKALADPTRMRILLLLSRGQMHGQVLAKKLNLSQPTVTHHASKLREVGLIKERRDKNTVYFTLNPELIRQHAEATVRFIFEKGEEEEDMSELNETLEATVLRNFFAKDGKLRQIPAQYKKKLIVLQMLAEKLEPGRIYAERELNEWIKQYHEDFATIRRELIMHQFMYREREMYELNPREMWTRWDQVR
ncbi:metalloregulator ArsR/SmtB family transcription factor [Paenibacillus jamilae]|uniref:DUF2087 domain-containing protein n=1 Tax=Paenibacillus jamilae TaxID=114136 RepID=UPI003D27FBBC